MSATDAERRGSASCPSRGDRPMPSPDPLQPSSSLGAPPAQHPYAESLLHDEPHLSGSLSVPSNTPKLGTLLTA